MDTKTINQKHEAVLELWDKYQADMRPETRNDFLRAFKDFRENLK